MKLLPQSLKPLAGSKLCYWVTFEMLNKHYLNVQQLDNNQQQEAD